MRQASHPPLPMNQPHHPNHPNHPTPITKDHPGSFRRVLARVRVPAVVVQRRLPPGTSSGVCGPAPPIPGQRPAHAGGWGLRGWFLRLVTENHQLSLHLISRALPFSTPLTSPFFAPHRPPLNPSPPNPPHPPITPTPTPTPTPRKCSRTAAACTAS